MADVLIERRWRSTKHGDVYLEAYADDREARAGIATSIAFDNTERFHQAMTNRIRMWVWRDAMAVAAASGGAAVERMDNAAASTMSPPRRRQTAVSLAA